MLPQFQRHEEVNLEAAERREQRLMELLRQSNEMQRGISAQIEALKAQVTELQSPTSRGPEQKGLPSPTRTVQNPTDRPLRYQETGILLGSTIAIPAVSEWMHLSMA